jgi:hypothetical protein
MISKKSKKSKKWSDFKRQKSKTTKDESFILNKFDETDWTW